MIRDGIFAQVAGTVVEVFSSKSGQAVKVEVKPEEARYGDKVTAWGLEGEFRKGDRLSVKGWLSVRRTTKDDGRVFFDMSLNKPVLVEHEPAPVESAEAWSQEPPEAWA